MRETDEKLVGRYQDTIERLQSQLTEAQAEMKRLQEDKASRGEMLDSTIATLKERTSQLTETRDQLAKVTKERDDAREAFAHAQQGEG